MAYAAIFTSLHFTSLHFTSLHYTSLHYTLLYFTWPWSWGKLSFQRSYTDPPTIPSWLFPVKSITPSRSRRSLTPPVQGGEGWSIKWKDLSSIVRNVRRFSLFSRTECPITAEKRCLLTCLALYQNPVVVQDLTSRYPAAKIVSNTSAKAVLPVLKDTYDLWLFGTFKFRKWYPFSLQLEANGRLDYSSQRHWTSKWRPPLGILVQTMQKLTWKR